MNTNFKTVFLVLPLALIVSSSIAFAKKPQYTEIEVGNGSSISGTIKFEGQVPPPVSVNLKNEKNSEFCLENANPNKLTK